MTRIPTVVALILVAACTVACAEQLPDRLQLMPTGPFVFGKKGQSEDVKVTAYVGPKPYTSPITPSYASSDTTVATVDDKGHITCTGSGKATITVTAAGATGTGEVRAQVVGGLEVKQDLPKVIKLNSKGYQLHTVVKDDKGGVIADPKLQFRATDYCVEVGETDGFIKPLTEGDCDIIVSVAEFSQRVKLSVKE